MSRASFRPYGAPGSTVVFNRLGRFYGTGLYNYPRSFVGGYPVFSYRRPNYGYFGVPAIGLGYHPFVPYSGIRSSQVTVSQTYAPTYNLYQGGVSQAPQNNPDNGSPTVPLSQADVKVFALDGRTSTGIQPNRPTPVVTITTQGSTTPAPANVMVRVPSQNAQLYFNGVKTKQSGLLREFRTPQLPSQKGYQYKVKVVWQQDGTQREKEHVVRLEAGQEVLVNLSDPRVLANESPSETPSTQKSVQFVTNK
ncbi:MAG: TIGR03000 domain-containing protein [Gemmataceae bacterium]